MASISNLALKMKRNINNRQQQSRVLHKSVNRHRQVDTLSTWKWFHVFFFGVGATEFKSLNEISVSAYVLLYLDDWARFDVLIYSSWNNGFSLYCYLSLQGAQILRRNEEIKKKNKNKIK